MRKKCPGPRPQKRKGEGYHVRNQRNGYVTIQSEQIEGWMVVAGAGRGIGAGIARRLCERGACVIVADLDLAAAEETAARLCGDGHRAQAGYVDVTEETSVEALGDVTVRLGNLVGWVNNAGSSAVLPPTNPSAHASHPLL